MIASGARLREIGIAGAPFAPAAIVLTTWTVWMAQSGGYFPRDWYPAGIALTLTVAVVAVGRRRVLPPGGAAKWVLVLLTAFVAWNFLSIAWAGSRASALDAANQFLLYLAGAWALGLTPWRTRSAMVFVAIWSLVVAAVCGIELVGAVSTSRLGPYIVDSRWSAPSRYANAASALAVMAAWPALMIASRRRATVPVQVGGLSVAVFLVEFSLLPQSRGSVLAALLMTPLLILLAPARARMLVRLAVVAAAVALTVTPIYDVFSAAEHRRPVPPVLDHAAKLILLSVALTALVGLALARAERFLGSSERRAKAARAGGLTIGVVALIGALGLVAVNGGRITRSLSHHWDTFTSDRQAPNVQGPRLVASDAHARRDMWRVALAEFGHSPVHGAGAGNFERVYSARRREDKPSRYAHNVWLRVLAETGVVGGVTFVAFVLIALGGCARGLRSTDEDGRALAAACLAVTVYFLLHASVDWLDVMPAVAGPAFAMPLVALRALRSGHDKPARLRVGGWAARLGVAAGAAVVAGALVVLSLCYLSVRYVDRGRARSSDLSAAFDDFDRAAGLNPFSAQPYLIAGTLAAGRGEQGQARQAFRRALAREQAWYPHLELALLDAQRRRFADARSEILVATRLNPREPRVLEARRLIERRVPIDPGAYNQRGLQSALDNVRPGK